MLVPITTMTTTTMTSTSKYADVPQVSDARGKRGHSAGSATACFHPDLFRTDTLDRPDALRVLATALSSANKSNTKFRTNEQMFDMFRAQAALIQRDGVDTVNRLTKWMQYERHVVRLLQDKGLDAASKYHFDLFAQMRNGDHDLWAQGYYNAQVMRDVDEAYPTVSRGYASKRAGGGAAKGGASNHRSSGKFTGEPCKHHGQHAKHTTSECKDPDLKSSRK